jgi:hypothetical protein
MRHSSNFHEEIKQKSEDGVALVANGGYRIERVRGREPAWSDAILEFWADRGVVEGDAARRRLADVVCVLLDADGAIAGVNSVFAERLPAVGGRSFWFYRALIDPEDGDIEAEMIDEAHAALADGFAASDGSGPIGLCVLVGDAETIRRRPETVWPGAGLIYAGYTKDGKQIRLGYFEGARV